MWKHFLSCFDDKIGAASFKDFHAILNDLWAEKLFIIKGKKHSRGATIKTKKIIIDFSFAEASSCDMKKSCRLVQKASQFKGCNKLSLNLQSSMASAVIPLTVWSCIVKVFQDRHIFSRANFERLLSTRQPKPPENNTIRNWHKLGKFRKIF